MSELKPCPFCGLPAQIHGDFNMEALSCSDRTGDCPGSWAALSCRTPPQRAEAIAAWNRRAQPAAPADAEPSVAPEPVAWMWRNTRTGAKGVYFEDPGKFFNIAAKDEYEWTPLFAPPDTENRRAQPAAPADAEPSVAPEPVAWLSVDCIGERYLCFSKPMDNDTVTPLFAHPPRAPLTDDEVDLLWRKAYADHCGTTMSFDWFEAGVRALEQAHQIGGK